MKETNSLCSSEGFITLTWNLKTLFAVVNYLNCKRGPGSQSEKFSGHLPDFTVLLMSNRYCWPFRSISGMTHWMLLKCTTGNFLHPLSCLSIGPEKDLGPVVSPSRVLNKCFNANTLKSKRYISRFSGLFTGSSIKRITPVFVKFVKGNPKWRQMRSNAISTISSTVTVIFRRRLGRVSDEAVSYTHLDVYKRQNLMQDTI